MNGIQLPDQVGAFLEEQTELLQRSYAHLLGEPLMPGEAALVSAEALFYAPFALVSHSPAATPIFNYANAQALSLFEFSWSEFTQLPSRYSAEAINQAEREVLLAEVKAHGFIRNYQGIRIAKSGKRFSIQNAVVWNLYDAALQFKGQAACFKDWTLLK